jgi:Zn finger protein HypA/HybF involved in hydrogenase expression
MALRITCGQCQFTVDLEIGRYLACPHCGSEVEAIPIAKRLPGNEETETREQLSRDN